MTLLAIAALLFVGSHFGLSSRTIRGALVERLGEPRFIAGYSVLQILLLVALVWAYVRAPFVVLWMPAPWTAWVPLLAMPLALLLMVGGLVQPNPTAVMQDAKGPPDLSARGIFTVTRHPVMWAFGLWALSHLAASGDAAGVLLFAAIAVLALAGTMAIDAKKRARWGDAWPAFAGRTSNLPLAAVAAGRVRLDLAGIGWRTPAIAAVACVLLLLLHPLVIGVAALPR